MSSPMLATFLTWTPGPSSISKRVTVGPRDHRATVASMLNWRKVSWSASTCASMVRRDSLPIDRPAASRSSDGSV